MTISKAANNSVVPGASTTLVLELQIDTFFAYLKKTYTLDTVNDMNVVMCSCIG